MSSLKRILLLSITSLSLITCGSGSITPTLVVGVNNGAGAGETVPHKQSNYDKNLNPNSFFIVVFGDLQTYTMGRYIDYYSQSCNWIRKQFDKGVNISCILQVGDVTQNNTDAQWALFQEVSDTLSSVIPFFVCIGNHDYSWSSAKIFNRSNSKINKYAHFPLSDKRIITYYKEGDLANYIARLDVEENISLIVLEFGPRKEVIDWAEKYIKSHPDQRLLLMTHEWLNSEGQRISEGSDAELQLKGYSSYSTPEEVWTRLVWPNDNIMCIICGHAGFYTHLLTENCKGRQVPQVLFNLQYLINGGNGLIQIWEFPQGSKTVSIRVYDTINQTWHGAETVSFSM